MKPVDLPITIDTQNHTAFRPVGHACVKQHRCGKVVLLGAPSSTATPSTAPPQAPRTKESGSPRLTCVRHRPSTGSAHPLASTREGGTRFTPHDEGPPLEPRGHHAPPRHDPGAPPALSAPTHPYIQSFALTQLGPTGTVAPLPSAHDVLARSTSHGGPHHGGPYHTHNTRTNHRTGPYAGSGIATVHLLIRIPSRMAGPSAMPQCNPHQHLSGGRAGTHHHHQHHHERSVRHRARPNLRAKRPVTRPVKIRKHEHKTCMHHLRGQRPLTLVASESHCLSSGWACVNNTAAVR